MRILVTGSSGSGTTTLGRALAQHFGFEFFDADDYYWLRTEPPFQEKREPAQRISLLLEDLERVPSAVVAGSVMEWGTELEDGFTLIVFLTLDAEIRVARLRERELARYGRVDEAFLTWAAQYEIGRMSGRNRTRHEKWLSERVCPVLRLDGDLSVEERVACIVKALANAMGG